MFPVFSRPVGCLVFVEENSKMKKSIICRLRTVGVGLVVCAVAALAVFVCWIVTVGA